MRNSTFASLTLVLFLSSICTYSLNSKAANLIDIYQQALGYDAEFSLAVSQNQSADLQVYLAKTAFRPSLSLDTQLARARSDINGTSFFKDDHFANISLTLPLYDKTKSLAIDQAKQGVTVSNIELIQARQLLILKVANRYFSLLAAQDAKEVAKLEKDAIKRLMNLAQERLNVGLSTKTDLYDARARFKQAEADEIQAENQISTEQALLSELIGETPDSLAILRADAPLSLPAPDNMDAWIQLSENNNLSIQLALINRSIARKEIEIERSRVRRPTFTLNGNHRLTDGDSFASGVSSRNSSSIGFSLRFPIYLGGNIPIRIDQAGYKHAQADLTLEGIKRQIRTEITSAYLTISNGVTQIEALADAVVAGENALQAKQEGYEAGLTTNLDVLDAQRDLSRSKTNYLRARYDYILAVLELERAAGTLNEGHIQKINQWLD